MPEETEEEDYETLLRRSLVRLKMAFFDPDTPPRDLGTLAKKLLDFEKELMRLQEQGKGGPGDIEEGANEQRFDPETDL